MKESSFADALREQSEEFVYGGGSAGAAVAGTTLHGVEYLDNKDDAPEVLYECMGLVSFAILPHWGLEKYGENLEKCKKEMEKYAKVYTITNEQAIIIDQGKVRII